MNLNFDRLLMNPPTTGPACPTWNGSSVVEQMFANGMVVGWSPTRSLGFRTGLATLSTPPQVYKLITYRKR